MSHGFASRRFWQAKIWGLLHHSALQSLRGEQEENRFWQEFAALKDGQIDEALIRLADCMAAASDRTAMGSLSHPVHYTQDGLEIFHLLSGEKQQLKMAQHDTLMGSSRANFLNDIEQKLWSAMLVDPLDRDHPQPKPLHDVTCPRKVFWWLWRCLPSAVCQSLGDDPSLLLMPAENRLPDCSIWGHTSLTAAFAGSLVAEGEQRSQPYLATFSFTPIQELIKASRKMRDFWAGSWILHYLSAKVSWALAWKYGPDCLIYPSLFQQPLIDHWLLNGVGEFKGWSDFKPWVEQPSERQLLTAGFPNVLVLLLPKDRVEAAMQMAEQTLKDEWMKLGGMVFDQLQGDRHWMPKLKQEHPTWKGWLEGQWQTYWSALPVGAERTDLDNHQFPVKDERRFQAWIDIQNGAYRAGDKRQLFQDAELKFLQQTDRLRSKNNQPELRVNVGSWWSHIFDQTRLSLTAVKNFRTWEIPTAFSVRSTVSGIGAAVHPGADWIAEGAVKTLWERNAGLFDGSEQLNATETLKRGLHLILPALLKLKDTKKISAAYPDLTVGVAGYLKEGNQEKLDHFNQVCAVIENKVGKLEQLGWGIPWIDGNDQSKYYKHHPRSLNPGWLAEDIGTLTQNTQSDVRKILDEYYPGRNPADWYVLAAGDGDGMNEWLKGQKLAKYRQYVPSSLLAAETDRPDFQNFLNTDKRMGPSTHSALSRALLDFSNQLVPYLTEQRYAGRLIYGGGDDVLAYTNLWEWDKWLWDIRQCFRGSEDSHGKFDNHGDYWQWHDRAHPPQGIAARPLFTMGSKATISFGVVIAHQSVPLAIALEQLWEAESEGAKEYVTISGNRKDAVQVRVLYGNGNVLKSTTQFDVFQTWRSLMDCQPEPALWEQAAQVWEQHPIPCQSAIAAWTQAFCDRRDVLQDAEAQQKVQTQLMTFLDKMWQTAQPETRDGEVKNWLKLAAFVLRNRDIQWRNP
jgi:CRISPR-associated protein Cmr2